MVRKLLTLRALLWVGIILFFIWRFIPGLLPGSSLLWRLSWGDTDFSKSSVDFGEIISGGPRKDGIPSIDNPTFSPVKDVKLADTVPVICFSLNGEAKAYPLGILISH